MTDFAFRCGDHKSPAGIDRNTLRTGKLKPYDGRVDPRGELEVVLNSVVCPIEHDVDSGINTPPHESAEAPDIFRPTRTIAADVVVGHASRRLQSLPFGFIRCAAETKRG